MIKYFVRLLSFVVVFAAPVVWAGPLDINSASADQIAEAMAGVGKSKADAIVQDRDKNGKFKSVDDLTRVKGIKSSTVEKNRDKITVGQAEPMPTPDIAKK